MLVLVIIWIQPLWIRILISIKYKDRVNIFSFNSLALSCMFLKSFYVRPKLRICVRKLVNIVRKYLTCFTYV